MSTFKKDPYRYESTLAQAFEAVQSKGHPLEERIVKALPTPRTESGWKVKRRK